MDVHNNLNREVDIRGRHWKIIDVSDDGLVYTLCDAYGREVLFTVEEVIELGVNLY